MATPSKILKGQKAREVQQFTSRLTFLDAASHLLMQDCPSLSSYLQSELSNVAFETKQGLTKTAKHEACGRCGAIAQPSSSKTSIQAHSRSDKTQARHTKNAAGSLNISSKVLITQCLSCGFTSKSALPRSERQKPVKIDLQAAVAQVHSAKDNPATQDGESKLNRKQKQRERKKQGSLQAMLAKSRQQSSSASSGLNLMDLMKGL